MSSVEDMETAIYFPCSFDPTYNTATEKLNKGFKGVTGWQDLEKSLACGENRAIQTGRRSGITVVDFDYLPTYERLIQEIPEIKSAYHVKTRKGYHVYFQYHEQLISSADCLTLRGVDIRNDGGCIIAPPSSYSCKGETYRYEELGGDIFPIPEALLALVKAEKWKRTEVDDEKENLPVTTTTPAVDADKFAQLVGLLHPRRADGYEEWSKVGFGIKNVLGDDGIHLFVTFSQQSPKFSAKDCIDYYKGIKAKKTGITIGSFHFWAKEDNPEGYALLFPPSAFGYEGQKKVFEENHFYLEGENAIVREEPSGELTHFGLDHARVALNQLKYKDKEDICSVVGRFISDSTRRTIRRFVAKMPADCAGDEMSLFRGFAYERMEVVPTVTQRTAAVELFHDLLRAICGDEEVVFVHVQKLMAHMIQRPLIKTGVMVAFASALEGTGKDTVMGILQRIIGQTHVAHYTDTEAFWEKHDTKREGAVFVYLEEACSQLNKKKDGQLKALVTSDWLHINRKGLKGYDVPNLGNMWMTTNEPEPFKVGESNRRGMLITPSGRNLKRDWDAVYDVVHREWFLVAIGEHLAEMDIGGWKPREFPMTEVKKEMMALAKSSEKEFFEQWKSTEWIKASDVFTAYQSFCQENNLPHAMNTISFCKRIVADINVTYQRRMLHGQNVYAPLGCL